MKIRAVLFLVIAVIATACGPSEEPVRTGGDGEIGAEVEDDPGAVADDSPPREIRADASEVLARCGGTFPEIAVAPAEGPADFVLTVRADVVRPGDTFEFEWRVPAGREITTGDEWLIECWVGDRWDAAWQAIRVYSEDPDYNYLDRGFGGDDDGWGSTLGAIVVPPDTPAGWYRLAERASLADDVSSDLLFREAWFEVVR